SAGVVEAVGDQVTYVKAGDHVITCLSVYCGDCDECLTGHPYLCDRRDTLQRSPGTKQRITSKGAPVATLLDLGSFAEQMLVHEHAVAKIPETMPLDRAALIGCAVT